MRAPSVRAAVPWLALLLVACEIVGGGDNGKAGDSGTGSDTGTSPSDTSGDPTGTGTGPDGVRTCGALDPVVEVDCDARPETPDPGSDGLPSCTTGVLSCGDTITGTLEGGSTFFDNNRGHAWEWCSGHSTGSELEGPERAYRLDVPANDTYVSLRLASCEPVQLLWYQTSDACPNDRVTCSYVTVDGATCQGDDIVTSGSGILYVVVESLGGSSGNYTLHVDCGET